MKALVGKRLKVLRKRLGLTQKEFAEALSGKIDYTYVGKLERGGQYPSLKLLERISEAFDIKMGYFFEDDSFLKSFYLFPREIRRILSEERLQRLLILADRLTSRELNKVCRIIETLTEKGI